MDTTQQNSGVGVTLAVRKSLESTSEHYLIEGYASRPVIDKHNEYMPLVEIEKAMAKYSNRPIITREHGGRVIGHTTTHEIDENGAKIKALIFDKEAQDEIDSGKLPDFSIEGFAKSVNLEVDGKVVKAYVDLNIEKVAVTKEGAVPGASHKRVHKSADGTEIPQPLQVRVLKSLEPQGSITSRVVKALDGAEAATGDEDPPMNDEEKPKGKKLPEHGKIQDGMLAHHNDMVKSGNMEGANWMMSAIASLQAAMNTLEKQKPIEDAEAKDEAAETMKSTNALAQVAAKRAAEANYLALGKALAADNDRIASAVQVLEGKELVAKSTAVAEPTAVEFAALKTDLGTALEAFAVKLNKISSEPVVKGVLGVVDGAQAVDREGNAEAVAKSVEAVAKSTGPVNRRLVELELKEKSGNLLISERGELQRYRLQAKAREIGLTS